MRQQLPHDFVHGAQSRSPRDDVGQTTFYFEAESHERYPLVWL